jgi:hypothetical protein
MSPIAGPDRTIPTATAAVARPRRRLRAAGPLTVTLAAVVLVVAMSFGSTAGATGATAAAPASAASPAEPGDTTTTLPRDNRELGNSLPKPNKGADPADAGDPGGWLQVSLFYLICGGMVVIAGLAWFSSRRARARRTAAGLDPVTLARATGKGVRAPSPLATKTTAPGPAASGDAS